MGFVHSAEPNQGTGFYKVRIELATDFNKLDHVYIIDNRFREEQQQIMKGVEEK